MVRVMVVDDSRFLRAVIRRALEGEGFEVICEAGDGLEAYELLKKCSPDVVLLDINMPRMDGIELLKKLKREGRLDGMKVIVLTAMDQPWTAQEALSLGAATFIPKPVRPGKLIEVVKRVAGRK